MRYLFPVLLLALAGCVGPYDDDGYAYGYGYGPNPEYSSGYGYRYGYAPGYQRDYADRAYYGGPAGYSGENCGTPDAWKACPRRWP